MNNIVIDFNSAEPIYIQVYQLLKSEMSIGRIKQGDKLPSIRTLAKQLNISKSTIENAHRLSAADSRHSQHSGLRYH